jgi:hypothetical protein
MRNYTPEEIRFIKKKYNLRHCFSKREIQFLEKRVGGRSYIELTEMFNRHYGYQLNVWQVTDFLHKQGLSNGIPQGYQKGHVSCLKGKKLPWLKRKNPEYNRRPIGAMRVNRGGYNVVKVSNDPAVWKLLHHVVWEKAHGPIPKGHVIIFTNRNILDTRLKNLILVSRRELDIMNRNGLIYDNGVFTKTGKLVADLKILINDRQREAKKRMKMRAKPKKARGKEL